MSFYGRVVWNSQPVLINEKRLIRSPRDWHCLIIKLEHLVYPHYPQTSNALSFYWSKMILDRPNHFGWVPIVLDECNLFWLVPNYFGQVRIIKISPEKSNLTDPDQNTLDPTKMIWTRPKWLVLDQNNLDGPNSFWSYRRTGHRSKFQSGDVNRRILSELVTHLFKIYILFFTFLLFCSILT